MVEGNRREDRRAAVRHHVGPRNGAGNRRFLEPGDLHGGQQRREPLPDLGHDLSTVVLPPAVAVPVHGEQQLRFDLREAVDDAADAELGRAARPDGSQAGGGQEGDQRLRDVREEGGHPIAPADSEVPEPGGGGLDLLVELPIGQPAPGSGLVAGDHGRVIVPAAQGLFGVVQLRTWEPAGAGHGPITEHLGVRAVGEHPEVVPQGAPELLEVGRRPLPEGLIVAEFEVALDPQPVEVAGDTRPGLDLRGGFPQEDSFGDRGDHVRSLVRALPMGAGGPPPSSQPGRTQVFGGHVQGSQLLGQPPVHDHPLGGSRDARRRHDPETALTRQPEETR